ARQHHACSDAARHEAAAPFTARQRVPARCARSGEDVVNRRNLAAWLALSAVLGCGCARAVGEREDVAFEEIEALPEGCAATLARATEAVPLAAIAGTNRVLVESNSSRCIDEGGRLVTTLRHAGRETTARKLAPLVVARDVVRDGDVSGDPSPHPDMNAGA